MAPRPHVPDILQAGPFHHDFGASAGLTPDQLRSKCWRRLFRNVSVHESVALTDQCRLDAVRLAATDARGGHRTDRRLAVRDLDAATGQSGSDAPSRVPRGLREVLSGAR